MAARLAWKAGQETSIGSTAGKEKLSIGRNKTRPKVLQCFVITPHLRRIYQYWYFMAWSRRQVAVRAEYQKQAITEDQKSLANYRKKVKGKHVPENSICFKSI